MAWIVLEMDQRSITAQPEDTLTVFAAVGPPRRRCRCPADLRVLDPPFRKVYKVVRLCFHLVLFTHWILIRTDVFGDLFVLYCKLSYGTKWGLT